MSKTKDLAHMLSDLGFKLRLSDPRPKSLHHHTRLREKRMQDRDVSDNRDKSWMPEGSDM